MNEFNRVEVFGGGGTKGTAVKRKVSIVKRTICCCNNLDIKGGFFFLLPFKDKICTTFETYFIFIFCVSIQNVH